MRPRISHLTLHHWQTRLSLDHLVCERVQRRRDDLGAREFLTKMSVDVEHLLEPGWAVVVVALVQR